MKSFHYTATNEWGEQISGTIESVHFEEASEIIRNKGLYIVSLQELERDIHSMRGDLYGALEHYPPEEHQTILIHVQDQDGEKSEPLQEGQATQVKAEGEQTTPVEESTAIPPDTEKEKIQTAKDSILFAEGPKAKASSALSEETLQGLEKDIQQYIEENGPFLQEKTKERLVHFAGKIDLLRETKDKKRLKNVRRELKRIKKVADREIASHHQEKWDEYEKKKPGTKIDSYAEFGEKVSEKRSQSSQAASSKEKLKKWWQVIDMPDENDDQQVLFKQQYESIWNEAYLFSGVLLAFYLLAFFAAYYAKRSGVDDHFLIRIFDTTLFKQLVLILFSFFSLLGIRAIALKKRLVSDILMVLVFVGIVVAVLM